MYYNHKRKGIRRVILNVKEFNRLIKTYRYDKKSVNRIYTFYYPRIVWHLNRSYDIDVAEAAAKELFLQLFLVEIKYYIHKPTVWMMAEAERLAAKKGKKKEKTVKPEAVYMLESEDGFAELHDALDKLDDESFRIIEMIYWEGYNQREIAEILRIEHAAVRKKHSRALKKIGKLLDKRKETIGD